MYSYTLHNAHLILSRNHTQIKHELVVLCILIEASIQSVEVCIDIIRNRKKCQSYTLICCYRSTKTELRVRRSIDVLRAYENSARIFINPYKMPMIVAVPRYVELYSLSSPNSCTAHPRMTRSMSRR